MKKLIAVLLLTVCLLTGCISTGEKNMINEIINTYFLSLNNGDYSAANALITKGDDGVEEAITQNELNDFLFKGISCEIWGIGYDKETDTYTVKAAIEQYSLAIPLARSLTEYEEYCNSAKASGKDFSEAALSSKWNIIMIKNIKANTEKLTFTVEIVISDGKIVMTESLRNALFGGALDVIKSIDGGNVDG